MENTHQQKKVQFPTNTNEALRSISIEHIVCSLLKNDYQNCVAKQVNNEIFLYGFDGNVIEHAAMFVSKNIAHTEKALCGFLREKKEAVVDHFKSRYQEKIVVYVGEPCRLHLLGQKDAVDKASGEYVDISEGRKSLSPMNMPPTRNTTVTKTFRPFTQVHFRFFSKSAQLEQVVNLEKVHIGTAESDCSIFIKGEEENVSRAIEYLNKISPTIRTNEIKMSSSGPISIIRSYEYKNEFENCLKKFDVLLEKKITYVCGRLHVTNRLHDNYSSIWLSSSGIQLTVKFSAFGELCVDKTFVMNERDPAKGDIFKVIRDGLVGIAVPDKVNRGQTDDNTIGNIIDTTLRKVASSRAKVVAFLISPFANWDFNSIMKCMVNSFVEWLIGSETAEGFSVILCVEKQADFVETDAYFESRLWARMKDFTELNRDQPDIKILKGHLDKAVADVIVNTVSPDLNLRYGRVSTALVKAAGQGLQDECKKAFPHGISHDDIVVTGGHALNCKSVFHITLQRDISSDGGLNSIRKAMMLCLRTASDYNFKSIAFPAMGTGSLGYPIKEVASEMVMAMERFTQTYKKEVSIKEVLIVIHPKDTAVFETFQRMVEKLVVTPTEVNIIFEITGMEKNVGKCQSWLLSKGRQPAKFTHEGGGVQATSDNAPHSPGTSHSPTDRLPDTGGCFTSASQYSAHYTTSRWPGFAQSTIKHKPNIENFNDSKLIKQQISVNTDEDVKDHTVKNTARDRPKTFNMQNVNVSACLNISYEYDNKTLVYKFDEAGIQVHIYSGDIINLQNIQAVVCSENKAGNAKGIIAKLLLKNGGEEYLQDKATKFRYVPAVGDIVTTTGGRNSYKCIIHAIMPRREPQAICAMYRNIFEEVAKKGFTSVSLPLLGTGVGDIDPETCTEMLLNELIQFCHTRSGDKLTIHIVINDEVVADSVKDVFTKTIDDKMNASHKPEKLDEDEFVKSKLKNEASGGEVHESHDQFLHKEEQLDEDKSVINKQKGEATGGEIHGSNDQVEAVEDCVICMDRVVDEKKLPCGHVFCAECIEGYFRVRKVCPTCGKVCGIVTGDQPDGIMEIVKQPASVAGYKKYKSIAICYTFDSGIQGAEHPHPGMAYKGIRRTAYLPDNQQGRQICCMLTVAFERRLVFTIGTSRTTGKESVITWNDVHHKTDMRPNTQFGYPDDTYLQRVGEELGVKGVTLQDVDQQLLKELEDDQFRKVITKMEK